MENPRLISLFTTDLLRGYGSEKYTVQLANAMVNQGCAVDLIVQVAGGSITSDIDPRVRQLVIGSWSTLAAVFYLARYLRKHRPYAFFTTMEKPSLMGITGSFFAGYRNIVPTIHFDIDAYTKIDHRFRRNILRLLVAAFYRYAEIIVAVSTGTGRALQRWVGSGPKIEVIYNGFNLADMRRQAKKPVDFRWFADKTIPVFVACGRLTPQKGFDILLHAFAKLRATESGRLIILGDGKSRQELEVLAESLGIKNDLAMPGFVKNPAAWFAASDVFVLSSRTEGFGNVLVEALTCGTEVVSTDCPSGPREILQGGAYGQLVPTENAEALATAMKGAFERRRQRQDQQPKVQAYLDNTFSLDSMGKCYLDLANRLNNNHKRLA